MVLKCLMILGDAEPREFVTSITPSVARGRWFTLFHVCWHGVFFDFEAVTCSLGNRTDQKLTPNQRWAAETHGFRGLRKPHAMNCCIWSRCLFYFRLS